MANSEALDQEVGQVVGTLSDGTEYRQVLLNPGEGEKHVTPDGRTWVAVREEVVDGKVVQVPFTIHWKSLGVVKADIIELTTFIVSLSEDPQLALAFKDDPDAVLNKSSLNEGSKTLLKSDPLQFLQGLFIIGGGGGGKKPPPPPIFQTTTSVTTHVSTNTNTNQNVTTTILVVVL